MRILDLGRSATFALFAKDDGFGALTQRARRLTGWEMTRVSLVGRVPPQLAEELGPSGVADYAGSPASSVPQLKPQLEASEAAKSSHSPDWIPLAKIVDLSQPIANGKRTPEQMAGLHGLSPERVRTVFANFKTFLPRAAQPGERATREAESGLISLPLSAEASLMFARAERWMRSRAAVDPVGLRAELDFLLCTYDRRDRDFHVKDPQALSKLTSLLANLGLVADRAKLIVRTVNPGELPTALPACATKQALGTFASSPVKQVGVRSASKAASYAKWVGVMAVTQAGDGCSSVYAAVAALGLSQL